MEPYNLSLIATVGIGLLFITVMVIVNMRRQNIQLHSKLERMTKLRLEERKGRTTAEKLLREQSQKSNIERAVNDETDIVKHLNFRVIGTFHSPFSERRGCPRQGVLVPSAIGYIQFDSWLQPQSTLDGLTDNFSHVWVIWQFHENTNSIQQHLLSSNAANNNNSSTRLGCKAKIKPPRLNGQKIGIFACRTPHRPNPIGLTKCKLIKFDKMQSRLYLSDIDMMDGTPILDIKPYIPYSDIQSDATVPQWCVTDSLLLDSVVWNDAENMDELLERSVYFKEYFDDLKTFKAMFEEILIRDIRSLHQRNKQSKEVFECKICDIILQYAVCSNSLGKTVTISKLTQKTE